MRGRASSLRTARGGFTLLELLIVLALTSLMAALALPSIATNIRQAEAHGEYLKFQQVVLDLRRQSFHEAQGVRLVSSGEAGDDVEADPPLTEAQLGAGWTYQLSAPIDIDAGGRCSAADVDLIHDGRVRMHLLGQGATCRFVRPVG
jgi:prepilin-type N-terminal cleavage/methylation domain-containing protein